MQAFGNSGDTRIESTSDNKDSLNISMDSPNPYNTNLEATDTDATCVSRPSVTATALQSQQKAVNPLASSRSGVDKSESDMVRY